MFQPNSLLEDHPDGTGDLNALHNGNWNTINNYINPAAGLTARLDDDSPPGAGNTVNASASVFTSDDVGATIFFLTDRQNYTISAFTSATKVTVSGTPGELAAQPFMLFRTGQTEYTTLIRGLVKRTRMIAGDNNKVPRWNNSLSRCEMADFPGYNVTLGRVLLGGGSSTDLTSSSDLTFDDSTDLLTVTGKVLAKNFHHTHATIASAASIQLDFQLEELRSINTLAHDVTFTSANLAAGRKQKLRIVCDGTGRNFTFPAGWVFIGAAAPASIAAGKTALLKLTAFGAADTDVVAEYSVQP